MLHLYTLPLIFALAGLVLYTVLGGADFGAGWWQLTAGRGPRAEAIREYAHDAIGPVWEANHVWLVFVLTVTWTAYPLAFGSIASTLALPLSLAALGIVLRGTSYAMRAVAAAPRETRRIDTVFALSSVLTPFALGAAVGAIASRRVPVGNAAGGLLSSWLHPTSLAIGALAVAASAYLAAVFLSADAARVGDRALEEAFRRRALLTGVVTGALALAALPVVRFDARPLYHGLLDGRGRAALALSFVAGVATLGLVWRRRYEPARFSAALAVAAIVTGWVLAQSPDLLAGLSVREAAAPHDTLVAIVAAVLAGGVILFPSLALLFRLVLRGTFDPAAEVAMAARAGEGSAPAPRHRLLARLAAASLIAGIALTNVAHAAWAHAIGVPCLIAFVALGLPAALPAEIGHDGGSPGGR